MLPVLALPGFSTSISTSVPSTASEIATDIVAVAVERFDLGYR